MDFYGIFWTFIDFYGLFMDFYGLLSEFWKISIFDQKTMQYLFKDTKKE